MESLTMDISFCGNVSSPFINYLLLHNKPPQLRGLKLPFNYITILWVGKVGWVQLGDSSAGSLLWQVVSWWIGWGWLNYESNPKMPGGLTPHSMWRLSFQQATCYSSHSGWSLKNRKGGKAPKQNTVQATASVTFAIFPLAKARYVSKPRVNTRGD